VREPDPADFETEEDYDEAYQEWLYWRQREHDDTMQREYERARARWVDG